MKTEPVFKVYIKDNIQKIVIKPGETINLKCSAQTKVDFHILPLFDN